MVLIRGRRDDGSRVLLMLRLGRYLTLDLQVIGSFLGGS